MPLITRSAHFRIERCFGCATTTTRRRASTRWRCSTWSAPEGSRPCLLWPGSSAGRYGVSANRKLTMEQARTMFAEIEFWPEQASTHAERVDALCYFLLAVTGAMGVMVTVLVLYFAVKYRRRSEDERTPRIPGSLPLELF